METIVIQTDAKKAKAIKQFLKAFGISFKTEPKTEESPYNPEFVKKILERSESAKHGNIVEYTDELRKELFGK